LSLFLSTSSQASLAVKLAKRSFFSFTGYAQNFHEERLRKKSAGIQGMQGIRNEFKKRKTPVLCFKFWKYVLSLATASLRFATTCIPDDS
jgi:hypothetical protein